ncbi:MAG: CMD domain protein [Hyphomicrobiales bacterium]
MIETRSDGRDEDVIDEIAGIEPGSRLAELRRQRAEVFRHSQGSHDVLLLPADPGSVSRAERAAIALRVAAAAKDERLAAHYRGLLREAGGEALIAFVEHPGAGGAPARLAALLRHADLLAETPRYAAKADLEKLEALGLSGRDIVAISQLIAFVSFQTRVLAGLRILKEERP